MTAIIRWLEQHMLSCPSKTFFHLDCPGCGIQRSFIALLKGDIYNSLTLYPALLPILVMLGYTMFHLKADFANGARNIKILQLLSATIIVCFYIYKIVNNKLTA
jgi:hypothetical protein